MPHSQFPNCDMCDTFVALPDATLHGDVIFGKNSDRPDGEIQDVVAFPTHTYTKGDRVQCTYISIPQVKRTLAVILSKPRWMWGAEMGANECGVVIGNEAVWTTQPYSDTGLLGMDLVRLGLERGETAFSALQVIVQLLEEYGQGGNCSNRFAMNYHNSLIIADPKQAWVLETAGQYWVAERIESGTRSISNNLSIHNAGTLCHRDAIAYASDRGLCQGEADFDFARVFSSGGIDDSPLPSSREATVRQLCQLNTGQFSLDTAKSILREHRGNICMHGSFISAGSQVSSLAPTSCEHYFIEQPFPCQQTYQQKSFPQEAVVRSS